MRCRPSHRFAASLFLLVATAWPLAAGAGQAARGQAPSQVGAASYFGAELAGKTTATGAKAKPSALTAASRTLPLGARAKVTNLASGKSVKVTVADRGPYAKHRIVDVSAKAARKLGMKTRGVARVKVTPLPQPAARSTRLASK